MRIPASACGVLGFKPSRGRVSNGPLGLDVTGLTVQGPIARTVRDAAAMLDVLAVPMPGDPYWAPPEPGGRTYLDAAGHDPGRLRIARYADPRLPGIDVDPACVAAYEDASRLLADLGHEVEDIANPFGAAFEQPFNVAWAVQQLALPLPDDAEPLLRPMTRWWRDRARATSAGELLDALVAMQLGARRVLAALDGFDAVLTPTLAMLPQRPEWFTEPADCDVERQRQTELSPYTAAFNITGQPSASLPLHWTDDDIPVGVMLSGRPAGDAQLLSLCAQVEAARPWRHRRPPLDPIPIVRHAPA